MPGEPSPRPLSGKRSTTLFPSDLDILDWDDVELYGRLFDSE
jgi:hypothetical protein